MRACNYALADGAVFGGFIAVFDYRSGDVGGYLIIFGRTRNRHIGIDAYILQIGRILRGSAECAGSYEIEYVAGDGREVSRRVLIGFGEHDAVTCGREAYGCGDSVRLGCALYADERNDAVRNGHRYRYGNIYARRREATGHGYFIAVNRAAVADERHGDFSAAVGEVDFTVYAAVCNVQNTVVISELNALDEKICIGYILRAFAEQAHITVNGNVAYACVHFEQSPAAEHGGKSRIEVLLCGNLLLSAALVVFCEIVFVCGDVYVGLLIRERRCGSAYDVGGDYALVREVRFLRRIGQNRPVGGKVYGNADIVELGKSRKLAHGDHLLFVVISSVVFAADRKIERDRIVFAVLCKFGSRKNGILVYDEIGKFSSPEAVALLILILVERFGRRAVRPRGVEPVPVGGVCRCRAADYYLAVAVILLHSLRGRERRTVGAYCRCNENAVAVILAAHNILRYANKAERGCACRVYVFAVVVFARGKFAYHIAYVFECFIILGRGAVLRGLIAGRRAFGAVCRGLCVIGATCDERERHNEREQYSQHGGEQPPLSCFLHYISPPL